MWRFIYGFDIVGEIQDSHTYVPVYPVVDNHPELHRRALDYFVHDRGSYDHRLRARLNGENGFIRDTDDIAAGVTSRTRRELSKGLIVGPFQSVQSLHQSLRRKLAGFVDHVPTPRVMSRFGVRQKNDVRAIDDGRSNGANRATWMHETISSPHFYLPAVVARSATLLNWMDPVAVRTSLVDFASAYRLIPNAQPWYACFAIFNTDSERVEYYYLPGHNFGLQSAVVNFNRHPELIVNVVRARYGVISDHYFDDVINTDLVAGEDTAREAVEHTVLMLAGGVPRPPGSPLRAPELDPEKRRPAAYVNRVLGVMVDTSTTEERPPAEGAEEPHVSFWVDPARVASILQIFRQAYAEGIMLPHTAASIRGKLWFLMSAAFAAVGRAATLPLVQRQYRDKDYRFLPGSELHHCLLFFEALLPHLPRLRLHTIYNDVPPLIIYTDASFWVKRARPRDRRSRAGSGHRFCPEAPPGMRDDRRFGGALGAVLYDLLDGGSVRYAAADPPWHALLTHFEQRATYIAELETLAALAVYSTYPDVIAGRKVIHFIDNTVALSALVHGYSGKPNLAKAVNLFYLQLVSLRATAWMEWVPSKANIADLPSRGEWELLDVELHDIPVRGDAPDLLAVPSVASWNAPLESWVQPQTDRDVPL